MVCSDVEEEEDGSEDEYVDEEVDSEYEERKQDDRWNEACDHEWDADEPECFIRTASFDGIILEFYINKDNI